MDTGKDFIHSFHKYLLSAYYIREPSSESDKHNPCTQGACFLMHLKCKLSTMVHKTTLGLEPVLCNGIL